MVLAIFRNPKASRFRTLALMVEYEVSLWSVICVMALEIARVESGCMRSKMCSIALFNGAPLPLNMESSEPMVFVRAGLL